MSNLRQINLKEREYYCIIKGDTILQSLWCCMVIGFIFKYTTIL